MRSLVIILFTTALAGCAREAEYRAFDRWIEAGAAQRPIVLAPGQPATDTQSPEPAAELAGLDDYIRYALEHNPNLRVIRQEWRAALERVPQARALPDPRLMYRYDSMEEEHGAGVAQGIILPPKLDARAAVALERAKVFEHRHHAAQQDVIQELKDAHAELTYVHQSIAVTRDNLALSKSIEEAATALYRAGKTAQADILRAQIEQERIENELATLQSLLEPTAARLNTLMARPAGAALPAPAEFAVPSGEVSDENLMTWMMRHNPDLAASQQEILAARKAIRAARLESLPDAEIGLEYMNDPMEEGVGVIVGFTLPLWREKYDALKREALADFGAATARRSDLNNQLAQQLTVALYELRDARRRLALFSERLIPKTRSALEATQAGYRADQLQLNDVLIARRDLLDLQLAQHRAVADLHQSLAQIERLVGAPLDELTSQPSASFDQEINNER